MLACVLTLVMTNRNGFRAFVTNATGIACGPKVGRGGLHRNENQVRAFDNLFGLVGDGGRGVDEGERAAMLGGNVGKARLQFVK